MRVKFLLPATAVVAAALLTGWWIESSAAARLQAELETARFDHRALHTLEAEGGRLRSLAPSADELASLRQASAESTRLRREIGEAQKPKPPPEPLPLGEWISASTWENRGRATPRATIETALWAAGGGDLTALESLLEIDPATRAKAAELLAKLPPEARETWRTPEAFIAGATTKNIPLTEAQVIWFHEHDADHAGIGLLLNTSAQPGPPASADAPVRGDNAPPGLPDAHNSKIAMIALHRSKDGWSLVVPAPAIDRMARELSAAGK